MDLMTLLDEVQTIARNGLNYSDNLYDRERYERLLSLAAQQYSQVLGCPAETIRQLFLKEIGQITPKLGADAAIFNDQGQILLMERADGSGWCLPCGWVEPSESPAQAAVREVYEETGLTVRVIQLVGVFTRNAAMGYGPHSMVAVVHWCEISGGELTLSHEGKALRYWSPAEVPNWHANHAQYAEAACACRQAAGAWQALSH